VRHRKPIPQRPHATAYSQQPEPTQPIQVQDVPSGPFDFRFGQVEEEAEEEAEDQVCHSLNAFIRCSMPLYACCADRRRAFFFVDGPDWG
jgi:hypothetical protein